MANGWLMDFFSVLQYCTIAQRTGKYTRTLFQGNEESKKIGKRKLLQVLAKVVNPLIIVGFALVYWLIGFVMYFCPNKP